MQITENILQNMKSKLFHITYYENFMKINMWTNKRIIFELILIYILYNVHYYYYNYIIYFRG